MNKIYFIAVLFVATLISSCTKDETDGMPSFDEGAVANLTKDANTNSSLPPDELATMDVKFDLNVIAEDEVSKVAISVFFNDDEHEGVYDNLTSKTGKIAVTLEGVLEALPELTEADIVRGSKISFRVTEIVMTDGRVFSEKELKTNKKDEDGEVVTISPAVLSTDFTVSSPVFNLKVDYYVACPSSLEGEYTVVSSMTSTSGGAQDNPTIDFAFDGIAVFKKVTPISYEVSNGLGGMYERLYGHWGAGPTTVKFIEMCGSMIDNGTVGEFGAKFQVTSSSISPEGVITVEWKNDWDDTGKNVYTPVK